MPQIKSAGYNSSGGIAIIRMASPPVNALGHPLRAAIVQYLERALADAKVGAVVLIGSERAFSAGADVRELGTPGVRRAPTLHDLNDMVENFSKPVVAAIGGLCLGGGLELAMCCHYRIALPQAALGLPEVRLGLIPGAGGTQRLPRLIGVRPALDMILSSQSAPASQFVGTPLVHALATVDLLDAAIAFAKEVAPRTALRVRDLPVYASGPQAREHLATILAGGTSNPALAKAAEAVAGALALSFDEAMLLERRLLLELMNSPESLALRQAFLGRSVKREPA